MVMSDNIIKIHVLCKNEFAKYTSNMAVQEKTEILIDLYCKAR